MPNKGWYAIKQPNETKPKRGRLLQLSQFREDSKGEHTASGSWFGLNKLSSFIPYVTYTKSQEGR